MFSQIVLKPVTLLTHLTFQSHLILNKCMGFMPNYDQHIFIWKVWRNETVWVLIPKTRGCFIVSPFNLPYAGASGRGGISLNYKCVSIVHRIQNINFVLIEFTVRIANHRVMLNRFKFPHVFYTRARKTVNQNAYALNISSPQYKAAVVKLGWSGLSSKNTLQEKQLLHLSFSETT